MTTNVVSCVPRKAIVTNAGKALLPLKAAVALMPTMSTAELADLSFAMHAINNLFEASRVEYDASLKKIVESGKVQATETIKPVRKWRTKAESEETTETEVKTEAELMAEILGVDAADLTD
jgi:hypothetical protein